MIRAARRAFAKALIPVVLAAWATASAACGPPEGPAAMPAAEGLPPYTPAEAALFDDAFDPAVFGIELDGRPPERSRKLPDRTRRADSVVPVRVATVTRDTGRRNDAGVYQLTFVPTGPPLGGSELSEPLQVVVGAQSPSFPLLQRNDSRFVATRVILFVRRYNEGGHLAVHWHGAPDTPEVRSAAERARLLDEIR